MDLAEGLLEALSQLPTWGKWLSVILVSTIPIIELRGALPAAVKVFGLTWGSAYVLSVIGNLLPVPLLLQFFQYLERFLRRWRIFGSFFDWLHKRTRRKGSRKIELWGEMGLILFVAIPLPVTGAWTGAFAANIFRLNKWKSFLAITIGVLLAGLIVLLMTVYVWWVGILIIAGLIVTLIGMYYLEEALHRRRFGPSTP